MSFGPFLKSLFEHGRVRLDDAQEPTPEELKDAEAALMTIDRQNRLELPGQPPPLSLAAAVWGAVTLFRGCQFLVFRAVEAEVVRQTLQCPCPESLSPATIYSVDLTFRFLPDLLTLARASSTDDPLVEELVRLAAEWPLSSVGVKGLEAVDVGLILQDRSLCQLYVDRIVTRRDVSRVTDIPVRTAVRGSLGLYTQLATPELAAALAD